MLYRPATPSTFKVSAARALRVVAGFIAASLGRRDDAYLEGLNEHGLRDLGIRRVEARDYHRFY